MKPWRVRRNDLVIKWLVQSGVASSEESLQTLLYRAGIEPQRINVSGSTPVDRATHLVQELEARDISGGHLLSVVTALRKELKDVPEAWHDLAEAVVYTGPVAGPPPLLRLVIIGIVVVLAVAFAIYFIFFSSATPDGQKPNPVWLTSVPRVSFHFASQNPSQSCLAPPETSHGTGGLDLLCDNYRLPTRASRSSSCMGRGDSAVRVGARRLPSSASFMSVDSSICRGTG